MLFDTITIVLLVSRSEFLSKVISSLELLDCNTDNTNIIAIVDGDVNLFTDTRNAIEFTKFNQRICVQYTSKEIKSKFDVIKRRKRISDLHNFAKKYINDCKYVLGVEDDTIVPKNALTNMHRAYQDNRHMGFIQGIEVGRWGVEYLGAWTVDDVYNPTYIKSTLLLDGIHEVDAGGFYCFMTQAEIYCNHEFKPFDNNDLGPDVDFGITLRQNGYLNYTDYSIKCLHLSGEKEYHPDKSNIEVVNFTRNGNRWRHTRL